MNRFALASVLSLSLVSMVVAATPSAKLTNIGGPVLVDRGEGFVKVSKGVDLPVGSRVLVSKGGRATIAYAAGCDVPLDAGSITTVVAEGGCAPRQQVAAQGWEAFIAGLSGTGAVTAVAGTVIVATVAASVGAQWQSMDRAEQEAAVRKYLQEQAALSP